MKEAILMSCGKKKKGMDMCQSIGEKVNNPSKTQEEQRLKSTEDGNREGGERRGRVIRREAGRRDEGFRWDDEPQRTLLVQRAARSWYLSDVFGKARRALSATFVKSNMINAIHAALQVDYFVLTEEM